MVYVNCGVCVISQHVDKAAVVGRFQPACESRVVTVVGIYNSCIRSDRPKQLERMTHLCTVSVFIRISSPSYSVFSSMCFFIYCQSLTGCEADAQLQKDNDVVTADSDVTLVLVLLVLGLAACCDARGSRAHVGGRRERGFPGGPQAGLSPRPRVVARGARIARAHHALGHFA